MTKIPRYNSIQDAKDTPFDNTVDPDCGFVSDETEGAIYELCNKISTSASPGFTWGRSGNVSADTWLLNDSVPSNKSGRAIFLNNAVLIHIFSRSENISTYDLEIYEHDGITYTLITTVNIVAARGGDFLLSVPLTTGKELGIKLVNGSAKNPVCGCILQVDL